MKKIPKGVYKVPVFFLDKHTPQQLAELLNSHKFDFIKFEAKRFEYDNVEYTDGKCVLKLNNQIQISFDQDYFVYNTSNYLMIRKNV